MGFGHEWLDVYRAATDGDRRRSFENARGSALECGAIQDVMQVCGALTAEENASRETMLDRIVAMRARLGQRGDMLHEESGEYAVSRKDTDADPEGRMQPADRQSGGPPNAAPPRR
jgi:hypothetical protein